MRAAADAVGRGPSEPASAALRNLSEVLLEDVDALANRLTLMVLKREQAYGQLGTAMYDELHRNFRDNIQRGIQSLAGQVPDGADPADTSKETGRARARQGVPLETVLRSYRLGGRVIWEALLEASRTRFGGRYDQELLEAAGYVWRVIDASSSALVDAYRLEEARTRTKELSRRHAFLNALLEGRGSDPVLAYEATVALDLPEGSPLLCVVAPVDVPGDEPLRAPHAALAPHGIVSSWHVRPADIVGLVAVRESQLTLALDALRPCAVGRVGVSPVLDGLGDVGVGYALATTAARTQRVPGLAMLDDRLPEALLAESPELTARLRGVAFGRLLALGEAERGTLLDTLDAVIACNGSPTHAAQRLYCHRNTVIYRLQRIEAVTGRSLTDPRDRLLFTLGLLARQGA